MNRHKMLRGASWSLAIGLCVLLLPAECRAIDPVEKLRDVLKPIVEQDPQLLMEKLLQQWQLVEKTVPELKTFSQLRRAYFLTEWDLHGKLEKVDPKLDIEGFRTVIGKRLTDKVRSAAQEPSVDRQIAVAMMIAEMAESDNRATGRSATGKFASEIGRAHA